MRTVILCGGKGTRLKEETEFKPKPMVEVGGRPLLWHIMKMYAHYGYNQFILALGYKGDYIKNFFLNQKSFTTDFTLKTKDYKKRFYFESRKEVDEFEITFVDTGLETEIGERILRCQKYIPEKDKYFMVTYGDGVSNLDIKNLVKFHKNQKTTGTITGVHPRSKYGVLKTNKEGLVKSFAQKPILKDLINGGFMIFDKKVFDYIEPGEVEYIALQRLAKEKQLSLYKHDGFWHCMDTYKDYLNLNKMWETKPEWKVWK